MNSPDSYLTVSKQGRGLYKEKGSKFISFCYRIDSENDIKSHLEELKKSYHDARHHCYAWVLGNAGEMERSNDDGEPSGTAGKPILGRIRSKQLTNTLVVVVRYFGGTLLGSSGLFRAYKTAAADAIDNAGIIKIEISESFLLEFKYPELNQVLKLLKEEGLSPKEYSYEMDCKIKLNVPVNIIERLTKRMMLINSVIIRQEDIS